MKRGKVWKTTCLRFPKIFNFSTRVLVFGSYSHLHMEHFFWTPCIYKQGNTNTKVNDVKDLVKNYTKFDYSWCVIICVIFKRFELCCL